MSVATRGRDRATACPPPHPGLTMESMGAPMVGECWPSPHPAAPADVSGTELSVLLVA